MCWPHSSDKQKQPQAKEIVIIVDSQLRDIVVCATEGNICLPTDWDACAALLRGRATVHTPTTRVVVFGIHYHIYVVSEDEMENVVKDCLGTALLPVPVAFISSYHYSRIKPKVTICIPDWFEVLAALFLALLGLPAAPTRVPPKSHARPTRRVSFARHNSHFYICPGIMCKEKEMKRETFTLDVESIMKSFN